MAAVAPTGQTNTSSAHGHARANDLQKAIGFALMTLIPAIVWPLALKIVSSSLGWTIGSAVLGTMALCIAAMLSPIAAILIISNHPGTADDPITSNTLGKGGAEDQPIPHSSEVHRPCRAA